MKATIGIEELYRRHARDVFRFAFWLSGDRAEADDLTSETFVRAWASGNPLRLATVKGYLFTIARNLFLQRRRRAGRRSDGRRRDEAAAPELPDPAPGPERSAHSRRELERTLAALATIPEAERSALLMRAEHGLAYAEIGRVLGISAGAARVRVHRARLKLASLCNPPGETHERDA